MAVCNYLCRYVILEHRWNGVHYDFMVEAEPGGLLRTWALEEEPCFGQAIRAQALPDHRRIYLDYEGEISQGRGTVRKWDEGVCSIELWQVDRVRFTLKGRQLMGPAEFARSVLRGEGSNSSSGRDSASIAGGASTWVFRFGKLS